MSRRRYTGPLKTSGKTDPGRSSDATLSMGSIPVLRQHREAPGRQREHITSPHCDLSSALRPAACLLESSRSRSSPRRTPPNGAAISLNGRPREVKPIGGPARGFAARLSHQITLKRDAQCCGHRRLGRPAARAVRSRLRDRGASIPHASSLTSPSGRATGLPASTAASLAAKSCRRVPVAE